MKPFFSVVIPTFNRLNVLSRSIDSVLNQTYGNFELIVVDNGSTDNTQQWLASNYQDCRIVYYYQNGSGSPASPRNKGISLAEGDWVCFLDSDDKWQEDKLQCVFDAIKNDKAVDVVCHNEYVYHETSDSLGKILKYGPASDNMYKDMLLFGNRLSTSATSIRKEFLVDNNLKFDESDEFAIVEDYDLWLNLASCNAHFVFLSESLGFYTVGESNMIANSNLFCTNLQNLLRTHVFSIQRFTKDKDKLWKLLKLRFDLCKVQYVETTILKKVISMFQILIAHPINSISIIFGYAKRKLTN